MAPGFSDGRLLRELQRGQDSTIHRCVWRRYTAGFIRAERDGFVDGAAAKELLQKSALPHTDLCAIWDLADMDRDGQLNLPECALKQTITFYIHAIVIEHEFWS